MKDPTRLMGKKQFTTYHLNGIIKSMLNGNVNAGGTTLLQPFQAANLDTCSQVPEEKQ